MAAEFTNIKMNLPRADLQALKALAKERGLPLSYLIRAAVKYVLEDPNRVTEIKINAN